MTSPGHPRTILLVALTTSLVLAGCNSGPWANSSATPSPAATERPTPTATPTEPPTDTTAPATSSETVAGEVLGYRVESAPKGATVVPASDDRIDVGGPVWRAVEAVAENGTATIPIEGDDFRDARATLRSLPSYANGGEGGVYVRTDDTVVRLVLSVDV